MHKDFRTNIKRYISSNVESIHIKWFNFQFWYFGWMKIVKHHNFLLPTNDWTTFFQMRQVHQAVFISQIWHCNTGQYRCSVVHSTVYQKSHEWTLNHSNKFIELLLICPDDPNEVFFYLLGTGKEWLKFCLEQSNVFSM